MRIRNLLITICIILILFASLFWEYLPSIYTYDEYLSHGVWMVCRTNRITGSQQVMINGVWKDTRWTHNNTICGGAQAHHEETIQKCRDEYREFKAGDIEHNLAQAYMKKDINEVRRMSKEATEAVVKTNEATV